MVYFQILVRIIFICLSNIIECDFQGIEECQILMLSQIFQLMQKQFSELLMKAASDYGALTASVADFHWSQNFKEPPSVWGVCLYSYKLEFNKFRLVNFVDIWWLLLLQISIFVGIFPASPLSSVPR